MTMPDDLAALHARHATTRERSIGSANSVLAHKKHTIIVGSLKIEIEFSGVFGWVMRVQ
jgi:hypothetical protein